jgi:hypothetical protein
LKTIASAKVVLMKAQDWTRILQLYLKNRGRREGYDIKLGEEMEILSKKESLKVRPDVIWTKDGKPEIIFEIDQFTRGNYQKTIYGSMLQGLVFAKQEGARFVEIVPNTENGRKACTISEILKEQYENLPEFCVIPVRKSNKPSAPRHARHHLKKQLDKLLHAETWKHILNRDKS